MLGVLLLETGRLLYGDGGSGLSAKTAPLLLCSWFLQCFDEVAGDDTEVCFTSYLWKIDIE
jgi:hypothetical protein